MHIKKKSVILRKTITHKSIRANSIEKGKYRYQWGIANRLLSKENELTGVTTRYDYDQFDFLIREENYRSETHLDTIYRMPDRIGNLYGTPDKKDRKYGAGGRLEEDAEHFYHYDDEGNLIYKELRQFQEGVVNYNRKEEEQELGIRFKSTGTGWRYDWQSNGMLARVIRPDEQAVHFRYDALGRRTRKMFRGTVTRWIWDGNVPLHEWEYKAKDLQVAQAQQPPVEPTEDVTTWVFEEGTFVPAAKLKGDKRYSIVTDYLGTPVQMYDEQGEKTWDCTLDVYGKVATFEGSSLRECPFRYQGQYEDEETGLYYNRFRYYEPETGSYLSQDPIGLAGGNPTLYAYVPDPNSWVDILGLSGRGGSTHQGVQDQIFGDLSKTHGNNVKIEGQIDLGNGNSRYGDIVVRDPVTGKITEVHQVGDMRSRGGFRPSSRERGAIMDIRQSPDLAPNAKIVFHDKKGRVTLINPDQSPNWKAPADKHRKAKGECH